MAIVVLVLWMFTAAAGFRLLLTSSLGRARPAGPPAGSPQPDPGSQPASVAQPAAAPSSAAQPAAAPSSAAQPAAAPSSARDRWAPPSLVAARQAPILPSTRSLVEFAHPAVGIIGLAFWLGFTLIHNRALGWIAFGLVAVTACVGLGWFTANTRAARRAGPGRGPTGSRGSRESRESRGSTSSFAGRLVALHGSAAAVTVALAALTALVLRG